MKTYNFYFTLNNINGPSAELEDALYECGCTDSLLSFSNGIAILEFDRDSRSLFDAIIAAIKDLKKCSVKIDIGSIGPGDVVNQAELARRLKVSREYIRKYIGEHISDGSLPRPISIGRDFTNLYWSYYEIIRWVLKESPRIPKFAQHLDEDDLKLAYFVRDYNDRKKREEEKQYSSRIDKVYKVLQS